MWPECDATFITRWAEMLGGGETGELRIDSMDPWRMRGKEITR